MRYSYPQIYLQEVPDEISLGLSISGCSIKCKGCHSKETWDGNFGELLTDEVLENLLTKHKHISCVLFYGGEWLEKELINKLEICRKRGLKTALFSGLYLENISRSIINKLDYLKVGPYIRALGSLASQNTNQKYYIIHNNEILEQIYLNKGN